MGCPGKWKHGLKPGSPDCLILTHTHVTKQVILGYMAFHGDLVKPASLFCAENSRAACGGVGCGSITRKGVVVLGRALGC